MATSCLRAPFYARNSLKRWNLKIQLEPNTSYPRRRHAASCMPSTDSLGTKPMSTTALSLKWSLWSLSCGSSKAWRWTKWLQQKKQSRAESKRRFHTRSTQSSGRNSSKRSPNGLTSAWIKSTPPQACLSNPQAQTKADIGFSARTRTLNKFKFTQFDRISTKRPQTPTCMGRSRPVTRLSKLVQARDLCIHPSRMKAWALNSPFKSSLN